MPPQLLVKCLGEPGLAGFHKVPLVDEDDDAPARAVGFAADRGILIGRPFLRIDYQCDHVGSGN